MTSSDPGSSTTRPFDEWARRILTQQALQQEFATLAVALERVIAQHRKVLPAGGGTAVCAECGQDRWDKRLCGTLQTLVDTLNWRYAQFGHVPGSAQGGQVRCSDAATESQDYAETWQPIRPEVWRFEDWPSAARQVSDPQRPGPEERDAGVRPGQARDPQTGGDAHLSASSGTGVDQVGGAGYQESGGAKFEWDVWSRPPLPLKLPPVVERVDEKEEGQ